MPDIMDSIYCKLFPPDGKVPIKIINQEIIGHIEAIRENVSALEKILPLLDPIPEKIDLAHANQPKKTLAEIREAGVTSSHAPEGAGLPTSSI